MAPDTSVRWGRVRESTEFDLAGNAKAVIIAVFYIGDHGPFTERFTKEEWLDPVAKHQRIETLRQSFTNLPT